MDLGVCVCVCWGGCSVPRSGSERASARLASLESFTQAPFGAVGERGSTRTLVSSVVLDAAALAALLLELDGGCLDWQRNGLAGTSFRSAL